MAFVMSGEEGGGGRGTATHCKHQPWWCVKVGGFFYLRWAVKRGGTWAYILLLSFFICDATRNLHELCEVVCATPLSVFYLSLPRFQKFFGTCSSKAQQDGRTLGIHIYSQDRRDQFCYRDRLLFFFLFFFFTLVLLFSAGKSR